MYSSNKEKTMLLINKNENGMILVLVLTLLAIISLLGATAVIVTTTDIKIGGNYRASVQAFYDADAGVNYAIAKIEEGIKANPQTFSLPTSTDPNDSAHTSNFTYTIPSGFSFSISDITKTGTNTYSFKSTGTDPNNNAKAIIEATFTAKGNSLFKHAAFGNTGVNLSGNGYTDSYDSSSGPWTFGTHNKDGYVGTNSTSAGAINLSGNTIIYGDAEVGVEGNPSTGIKITGNTKVLGDKLAADGTKDMTPLADPGGGTPETLDLSGNQSKTLNSGTYRLPKINIKGNATGYVNGDVTLYVDSKLDISENGSLIVQSGASLKIYVSGEVSLSGNGLVNKTVIPEKLLLFGTSSCNEIKISGNGNLYGGIYAPNAEVSVSGNGDIYGSVAADSVKITGNGNVHYDEALEDTVTAGAASNIEILSWRQ